MPYIGIDIGGTTIKAGCVTTKGVLLKSLRIKTEATDFTALLDTLLSTIKSLSKEPKISGVGIGIPGLLSDNGTIKASPNVPCLINQNLEAALQEHLEFPTVGRNDADMHAWGEYKVGAAKNLKHLAFLTLGTGVGSGLILNGTLFKGASGYTAEIGHMVVDPDGQPCLCGGRGCLETTTSARGIVRQAEHRLKSGREITAEAIAIEATNGNEEAKKIFKEAGRFLGIACANIINTLHLEMIVIGGGVANAGRLLLDDLLNEASRRCQPDSFNACRIIPTALGTTAGVVGAALYAHDILDVKQLS